MSDLALLITTFPCQEFQLRRLYASSTEFRTLCEDYATAQSALERWKSDGGRAEEYRLLCEEIKQEIREHLQEIINWRQRDEDS